MVSEAPSERIVLDRRRPKVHCKDRMRHLLPTSHHIAVQTTMGGWQGAWSESLAAAYSVKHARTSAQNIILLELKYSDLHYSGILRAK